MIFAIPVHGAIEISFTNKSCDIFLVYFNHTTEEGADKNPWYMEMAMFPQYSSTDGDFPSCPMVH